jgi:alpha-N-arabinofuranosidase
VEVHCLLGGWGQCTGRAWFDDVRLDAVRLDELKPKIVLDAGRTAEPISKYIYSQFIEHLGRCIYGGIWAELLEDRKFFHPVGTEASPWRPIGGSGTVVMDRADPFVGEHTPRIDAASGKPARGLAQPGLGLQKGKSYVGRIWLRGTGEPGPIEVSVVWGDAPRDRQTRRIDTVPATYTQFPLEFTSAADTDDGRLEIVARGNGSCHVGTVSLMPGDNISGMRADTLELLKELNAPMYRWPGGNFVSGYDWRDGVGDRDRRPPRKNPAWKGIEHNDFGLDEFIAFCREINAEPLIIVNSGFGDAHSAAQEVEYANGSPDTPMGRWRAANGHPEPYGVRWWGIGNEMYGGWQLGHMQLHHYVLKHNRFVDQMRRVDPSIQTIAVGDVGPWSQGMLEHCADHMELISEHFYRSEKEDIVEHVRQVVAAVRDKADAHRRYRGMIPQIADKDIRIALDEWNLWHGPHVYGELGVRYFLRDALAIAAGLHEYSRHTDIIAMAHYAQTVNVIGCIKTSKTAAAFATTGLVLKLYRQEFGELPVRVAGTCELFNVDVAAAWTADRTALTIGVINPHERPIEIRLAVKGATLAGQGSLWVIAGDDPMLYNEPGQPPRVTIEKTPARVGDVLTVPPLSVSLYKLAAEAKPAQGAR